MNKKKKVCIALAVVVCIAAIAGGIAWYVTTHDVGKPWYGQEYDYDVDVILDIPHLMEKTDSGEYQGITKEKFKEYFGEPAAEKLVTNGNFEGYEFFRYYYLDSYTPEDVPSDFFYEYDKIEIIEAYFKNGRLEYVGFNLADEVTADSLEKALKMLNLKKQNQMIFKNQAEKYEGRQRAYVLGGNNGTPYYIDLDCENENGNLTYSFKMTNICLTEETYNKWINGRFGDESDWVDINGKQIAENNYVVTNIAKNKYFKQDDCLIDCKQLQEDYKKITVMGIKKILGQPSAEYQYYPSGELGDINRQVLEYNNFSEEIETLTLYFDADGDEFVGIELERYDGIDTSEKDESKDMEYVFGLLNLDYDEDQEANEDDIMPSLENCGAYKVFIDKDKVCDVLFNKRFMACQALPFE